MPRRTAAVLASIFILGMCALCVRLGFWQLSRLEQRQAANAVVERGMSAAPVALTPEVLRQLEKDPAAWRYRRVRAAGEWLPGTILLRGRADGGRPGVHVVSPLRTGGSVLLVNRGWFPAPDGSRPDQPISPVQGAARVQGLLMEIPRTDNGGQPSRDGQSYRRLDLIAMRSRFGGSLVPLYLQAAPSAEEALPRAVGVPELTDGPHLSYAIQWFGFAATGVIGLLILLFRNRRWKH